ncbi:MAG: L,D-transpeptidase family protein [Actinomycetaceae bacterium]|nr:L,D-transpeptidase family protein [Actinomycetaceae bacterium]
MSNKDFIQDPDRGATDPFEQYKDQMQDFPIRETSSFESTDSFPFPDSDAPLSTAETQHTKDIFELDESLFTPPSDTDAPIFSFDTDDTDKVTASDEETGVLNEANSASSPTEDVAPSDSLPSGELADKGETFNNGVATDTVALDDNVSVDDSFEAASSPHAEGSAEESALTTQEVALDTHAPMLAGDESATQVSPVANDGQLFFASPLTDAPTDGDNHLSHSSDTLAEGSLPAEDTALTQPLPPAIPPVGTSDDTPDDMVDTQQSDEQEKPRRFGKKFAALLTGAVALVALIAGAIGYYVYYQDRALPGTQLAGVDVSGQKQNDIEKLVASKQKDLRVTFAGDIDTKQAFPLDKMGATIDAKKTAEKVLAPNRSLGNYIKAPFSTRTIEPDYSIKPSQAAAFAVELSSSAPGAKDPVEPRVQLSDDKETFTIVEGEDGVGVSSKDVEEAAKQAITTFKNSSKKVTVAPTQPFLSVDDLKPIEEQANALSSLKVALTVGDKKVEPQRSTKAAWVVIPEDTTADKPSISDEHVRKWVDEQAASISVEPKAGKQYVSSSGKVLKTESEPVDGKKVTNQEEIAKEIKSAMEENKTFEDALTTEVVKAEVDKKVIADGAEKLAYMAAPGEKWVDINLSNRTVTPYVGATAQSGPFLMVPGLPATPTVTGSFKVWHKTRSQTMEGFNTDGSRYKVPGVQWNTFFHSGYAMHAAHWRSTFGPGAGGGSHGCVNMDFSGAKYIYEFAPIGTPVVSHY